MWRIKWGQSTDFCNISVICALTSLKPQGSRGIVGIKGAEFANMIWLDPDARVILFKPIVMKTLPVQEYLARILGLDYIEIECGKGAYPELNASSLEQYLVTI